MYCVYNILCVVQWLHAQKKSDSHLLEPSASFMYVASVSCYAAQSQVTVNIVRVL
jgi:hypothetical protein